MNKVCVLLCSFNGERFIADQIQSILDQTYKNIELIISDDGSTDGTISIIKSFQIKNNSIKLITGPKSGFVENYLYILRNSKADFYAWCDQDDVWMADKISRGIKSISAVENKKKPILYCSRSILTNSNMTKFYLSPNNEKGPSFGNALIQNIASGNTFIFNEAAKKLLSKVRKVELIQTHDWAMYQLVTSNGGLVIFDTNPSIYYRQHENNLIGMSPNKIKNALSHLKLIFSGRIKVFNKSNALFLKENCASITLYNIRIINKFLTIDELSTYKKIKFVRAHRIQRQDFFGQTALYFTIILNKF